MYRQADVDRHC